VLFCLGCGPAPLTVEMPLHLEDHLEAATITGSELPANPPQPVEWRFDQPQPDWKAIPQPRIGNPTLRPARLTLQRTTEALRVTLPEGSRQADGLLHGGVYVDLPGWRREEWAHVVVRARTSSVTNMGIGLNLGPDLTRATFARSGGSTPIVNDGSVQTYQIRLNWGSGPWLRVGFGFRVSEPGSIDLLSISVVPKGAVYAEAPHGVRSVTIGERIRRTLYTHAPGSIAYRVRVPEGGRLDAALGRLGGGEDSVTFRVGVRSGGEEETLFEERYADSEQWAQRSVDLSRYSGQNVTLTLETQAEQPGAVAFWGAPTVSGVRATDRPNIIFYVIDGGSADYMSAYGYNRRTTPNLERIAAEGALFERAYSNSSWTRPSTASFLTSLQHSVLGGLKNGANPVPEQIPTIAQHLHRVGYQTAELTSNPNAGRVSNLERGNDAFRDAGVRPNHSISSVTLHENFWQWRTAYPAEPYWVHFQTTDVHSAHHPVAPFAGLFISPDRRQLLDAWDERLQRASSAGATGPQSFVRAGVSSVDYYTAQRDLHDETMAHQDYRLGQLVARLKAEGEWERTLLIVAADHGVNAGAEDYGILMREPLPSGDESDVGGWPWPKGYSAALLQSGVSHVPLVVVWPGRIAPGQRFADAVSMIDVLPTILDLVDLPMPEVMQGQSLAPLLLGESDLQPRPVILDEFEVDAATGELRGRIEAIDGRWGASLQINDPAPGRPRPRSVGGPRPVPLLLFDLWNDPMALQSLHEQRPDLVAEYTQLLEEQWEAHRLLARRFTPGGQMELTPAQLETLRSLGYIR
jgi:arylsulfatase A-like enzyme